MVVANNSGVMDSIDLVIFLLSIVSGGGRDWMHLGMVLGTAGSSMAM